MANIRVAIYKRFNGVDWDTVYYKAPASVISETSERVWFTPAERTNISTYLTTFNAANKLVQLGTDGKIPSALINADFDEYLKKSGGTMTGILNMETNTITFGQDGAIDADESGHITIEGRGIKLNPINLNVSVSNNRITDVNEPVNPKDAANKTYVDNLAASGVKLRAAVKAATTSNITLSAPQTIDGIALVAGDRVLVKNQTTATQNGVYEVKATAWTKIEDDSGVGVKLFVEEGTVNNDSQWFTRTLNVWEKFSQVDQPYIIGAGLSKSGNTISISSGGVTNAMLAGSIVASKLANFASVDTVASPTAAATSQALTGHIQNLYSAIKLLRGTTTYNTTFTDTIATVKALATTKNRTYEGTAAPGTSGYVTGDVYIQYDA